MEVPFVITMIAVALTLIGQTALIGIWVGRTSEKVENLGKSQNATKGEVIALQVEQGILGKTVARLQGLLNSRHEERGPSP